MSLSLNPIQAINICDGGWKISPASPPALASGQALLLEVGATCTVDISTGFTKNHMVLLLEALAQQELWAQKVNCRALLVEFGGRSSRNTLYYSLNNWGQSSISPQSRGITVIETSKDRTLTAPVKPYGPPNRGLVYGRHALVQLGNASPRIVYKYRTGDNGKELGDGRLLTRAYNKRYYFMNQYWKENTPFVTDNAERGFDCTTFILEAYDCYEGYAGGRGDDVATNCLNARDCGVSDWTGEQARSFFRTNARGEFVMWSEGHVVMVVDSSVHEFTTRGIYGYCCTPVDTYLSNNAAKKYSVMVLPGTNYTPVAKPAEAGQKKQPASGQPGVGQPGQGQQPGIGIGPVTPGGSLPPTTSGGRSYIPNQNPGNSVSGSGNLYTQSGGIYGKKPT